MAYSFMDLWQDNLIRIRNNNSASYADQSNYCLDGKYFISEKKNDTA